MKRPAIAIGAGVAALILAAGCGDDVADKAAEKLTEKAIESEGGGDVDVDIDTDSGKWSVKSEEGTASFESGGDIPDWLSEDVPIPAGAKVMANISSGDGSYVQLAANGSPKDVFEKFKMDLAGKGIDLAGDPVMMETGDTGLYTLEFADKSGRIVANFTGGDENETIIHIALAPETAGE